MEKSNEKTKVEEELLIAKEKDLNEKILTLTLLIKNRYPELSKYIEEMPVTVPNKGDSSITSIDLHNYYESLNTLLRKYILEHPDHL